ncbi:MAG: proline--tRNA ligase [Gemmatimonadota bacterium]|nr:proline--tRNA ligase [Gemmatimonadota bacterium]
MAKQGLTPQGEDFSAWYNEIVQAAELASHSQVRGCMVVRPYGYRIWELIQAGLDRMFKDTGHENAYFPLFLPKSALDREADHVEGFAPETAVVTHAGGRELEEPLVVRPTSEAIIWPILADWIQSYRDLPVLLNQWANVVRWELRTRPFLRTTEFLWQEGHTAHATDEEAEEEARRMLGVYRTFMDEHMGLAVVTGEKTPDERFAGAKRTYATEALMKDGKALQAGTSHHLGQNFARAFDVQFQTEHGEHDYVWSTSWGVSTRLIGALIMTHGDDQGLVLPPRLAPFQVVIVPIWKSDEERARVMDTACRLELELGEMGVRVKLDGRETHNPGAKFYEWERKGVPLRIEIGPRDIEAGQAVLVRRLVLEGQDRKAATGLDGLSESVPALLDEIQSSMLEASRARREASSRRDFGSYEDLRSWIEESPGFAFAGWCGGVECARRGKEDLKVTIRVIPDEEFRSDDVPTRCVVCDQPSTTEALWARAY